MSFPAMETFVPARHAQAVLDRRGFETVFPGNDPDTVRKCSEAAIIVGIDGSDMVNQIFAPPGGAVVLLVDDQWRGGPEDPDRGWTNSHNLHIAPEALEQALATLAP